MSDRALMLSLLQQMEDNMRAISLWEGVSPPATAFASELPFCVDTLRFSQWLQWCSSRVFARCWKVIFRCQ